MPYVSNPVLDPNSKSAAQATPAACPNSKKTGRNRMINSSFLRPSTNRKVNMPLINQIAKTKTLFLRFLFPLSSLLAHLKKVNLLIINQIADIKRRFSRF
jgi:hypothetical protein